jgi:hypothetical protein
MILQRLTEKLVWMFNRLSCMSIAEVFYRMAQICVNKAVKFGVLSSAVPKPNCLVGTVPTITFNYSGIEDKPYRQEADAILAGWVILFAGKSFNVGSLPDWNRDPLTGIVAPCSFGLEIAVTNRALVGDIKYTWELNRHLHLVRLAQAYVLSGDSHYLYGLAAQINAWLVQCPPLIGVNWMSPLELGIRLINWSLIWQMLGGWDSELFKHAGGEQLRSRWLDSIFAHCQFITRHVSRHSSANNHLIGELAGLYVAARTWPYWHQSTQWAEHSKAGLEREAQLQYSTDGVNREQAFAYQLFTLEFLMAAGIYGQRNADAFSDDFWQMLYKALCFLISIRDVAGHIPQVGDADDGIVLRLEPGVTQDRVGRVLALGGAIFGATTSAGRTDTVKWLLGDNECLASVQVSNISSDWQFPDGGYFIFGANFGKPNEIKGLLDCGALGYLGIAAHGHADALAVTLSIAGEECLVDSGTFSYWQDQRWRDYFRGTSAHNTIRVDGVDQSVSGGRFMWTRKAQTTGGRLPVSPMQFDFSGFHDGYSRLADPVHHQRSVRFDGHGSCLLIRDVVSGKTPHNVEQFWHFGATVELKLTGNRLRIKGQRFKAVMEFLGADLQIQLFSGNESLPLGWLSRAYDEKQPIQVLRVQAVSSLVTIEARLTIDPKNSS